MNRMMHLAGDIFVVSLIVLASSALVSLSLLTYSRFV